jgi:light-regulated signal transduction histidine kinase (bacteriophytochrome)
MQANTNAATEEFRELGEAFNRMAERLKKRVSEIVGARQEIEKINHALEERVRERTAELANANKELESFSYSVSHDLRAPLRHLDGFTQLLLAHQKDRLDAKGQRYLSILSDSARKMGTLIDDLLSFSRMGRKEMMKDRVDMNRLVQEVVSQHKAAIGPRDVEWVVHDLPEVQGDSAMIRQVWANLISNALKYSRRRERTQITIESSRDGKQDIFVVKDNGAGFDMAYKDKLFGVFQRLHHDSEFEGTGIGLANVRRIVTRHGGRTWADSILGEGATFYFSIPRDSRD